MYCISLRREKRAKDEIRTRDPNLGKVVLYQLSYFRLVYVYRKERCYSVIVDANISTLFLLVQAFLKKLWLRIEDLFQLVEFHKAFYWGKGVNIYFFDGLRASAAARMFHKAQNR